MPKAYIIAQSAISYRRYITRSVKERISLWHLPYGGCHKGGRFLYEEVPARTPGDGCL